MIHDIAMRFTFSNQAQSPAKAVLIQVDDETIWVEPGQEYGPVSFIPEENETILFQPEDSTSPLILQWTENNELVLVESDDWKNNSTKKNGHFEFSAGTITFIIWYQLKVKNKKIILLKFSVHTRYQDIDTI